MSFPVPNMDKWSIHDFELAIDGIQYVKDATIWLQNQPRAEKAVGEYHLGADFIIALGEDWCSLVLDSIITRLQKIRFDSTEDEDRRIRLLVIYYAGYGAAGEPIPAILELIGAQMPPVREGGRHAA